MTGLMVMRIRRENIKGRKVRIRKGWTRMRKRMWRSRIRRRWRRRG